MSCQTNIDFKCDVCGHDRIVAVKRGAIVLQEVGYLHEEGTMIVVSGLKISGGRDAGYACGECLTKIAHTSSELFKYLREKKMIGEWRDVDNPM